jgi:hypothetical protein
VAALITLRSGWDIMLPFWQMPQNEVLDLEFSTFRTFRKVVKSHIGKDEQFSILSRMRLTCSSFWPKTGCAQWIQN